MKKILTVLALFTLFTISCSRVKKGTEQIINEDEKGDTTIIDDRSNDFIEEAADSINIRQDSISF